MTTPVPHVPRGWTAEAFAAAAAANVATWPAPTAEQHAEIKRLFAVVAEAPAPRARSA